MKRSFPPPLPCPHPHLSRKAGLFLQTAVASLQAEWKCLHTLECRRMRGGRRRARSLTEQTVKPLHHVVVEQCGADGRAQNIERGCREGEHVSRERRCRQASSAGAVILRDPALTTGSKRKRGKRVSLSGGNRSRCSPLKRTPPLCSTANLFFTAANRRAATHDGQSAVACLPLFSQFFFIPSLQWDFSGLYYELDATKFPASGMSGGGIEG